MSQTLNRNVKQNASDSKYVKIFVNQNLNCMLSLTFMLTIYIMPVLGTFDIWCPKLFWQTHVIAISMCHALIIIQGDGSWFWDFKNNLSHLSVLCLTVSSLSDENKQLKNIPALMKYRSGQVKQAVTPCCFCNTNTVLLLFF